MCSGNEDEKNEVAIVCMWLCNNRHERKQTADGCSFYKKTTEKYSSYTPSLKHRKPMDSPAHSVQIASCYSSACSVKNSIESGRAVGPSVGCGENPKMMCRAGSSMLLVLLCNETGSVHKGLCTCKLV